MDTAWGKFCNIFWPVHPEIIIVQWTPNAKIFDQTRVWHFVEINPGKPKWNMKWNNIKPERPSVDFWTLLTPYPEFTITPPEQTSTPGVQLLWINILSESTSDVTGLTFPRSMSFLRLQSIPSSSAFVKADLEFNILKLEFFSICKHF